MVSHNLYTATGRILRPPNLFICAVPTNKQGLTCSIITMGALTLNKETGFFKLNRTLLQKSNRRDPCDGQVLCLLTKVTDYPRMVLKVMKPTGSPDSFGSIWLRSTPYIILSVQFSSVTQSCSTLCKPMNHSTPGLPVRQQLPEFTQTHVHWVSDAIQPSHPLSSPSPPAPSPSFSMSQLFTWGGQSIGVSASASVLPMNTQDWSALGWTSWISLQSKGLSRVLSNTTV